MRFAGVHRQRLRLEQTRSPSVSFVRTRVVWFRTRRRFASFPSLHMRRFVSRLRPGSFDARSTLVGCGCLSFRPDRTCLHVHVHTWMGWVARRSHLFVQDVCFVRHGFLFDTSFDSFRISRFSFLSLGFGRQNHAGPRLFSSSLAVWNHATSSWFGSMRLSSFLPLSFSRSDSTQVCRGRGPPLHLHAFRWIHARFLLGFPPSFLRLLSSSFVFVRRTDGWMDEEREREREKERCRCDVHQRGTPATTRERREQRERAEQREFVRTPNEWGGSNRRGRERMGGGSDTSPPGFSERTETDGLPGIRTPRVRRRRRKGVEMPDPRGRGDPSPRGGWGSEGGGRHGPFQENKREDVVAGSVLSPQPTVRSIRERRSTNQEGGRGPRTRRTARHGTHEADLRRNKGDVRGIRDPSPQRTNRRNSSSIQERWGMRFGFSFLTKGTIFCFSRRGSPAPRSPLPSPPTRVACSVVNTSQRGCDVDTNHETTTTTTTRGMATCEAKAGRCHVAQGMRSNTWR